jgi:hypothetical protein
MGLLAKRNVICMKFTPMCMDRIKQADDNEEQPVKKLN